jgi:hypothetical protein
MNKIYKKIVTYEEVTNKSLDDILLEIAVPIIKRNKENNWIDDNYMDILSSFKDQYKYDEKDYDLICDKISNLIKIL